MPVFEPFAALRYSDESRAPLVTAPPYDVISKEERERLLAADPHNVIRLTLGGDHPSGPVTDDRYARAASCLREWVHEGILGYDTEAFYVLGMDHDGGTTMGILGALGLEELGDGHIFPHERTLPAPKADRLELMRTSRANLEPLWFFASRPVPAMSSLFRSLIPKDPNVSVTDPKGVSHRLWKLDPRDLSDVRASIEGTPLVIADGHHRYETAMTYRREREQADGEGPWGATLAYVSDPQDFPPMLLPIHRVVEMHPDDIEPPMTPFTGSEGELTDHVRQAGPGTIGVLAPDDAWTISNDSPDLDTAFLADIVKDRPVRFEHSLDEVTRSVRSGSLAFVLAPVAMQTVADLALSGTRMPPKTTLFTPKPLSGLVMRDLGK